ncbi:bile acid:sodium symporter family protein [Carboxylicivirga caseinilyticus]|uniref:bile acid:sodium symporter family protein n=1 Tax=Carboxylicivirga caseinilyticus TaxID=3417572 RepID=UPI003D344B04|nr:bile acid:sodium symporter [Marinilabiliaceae bacterium A049]
MKKIIDPFILALMAMIALGWLMPEPALYNGWFSLEKITQIGIALIFFFYGLKLSPREMRQGMNNIKLHLLVQITTFALFPLLILAFYPLLTSDESRLIWLAIFFLAALPSTVSSSVVMVVMAKGNVPGAIFNASLSGLIGILITPLWIGLFINTTNASFELSGILISLFLKILLPVIIGLFLHRFWGKFVKKHSKKLALFDKSIILLIVYKSFAKSFNSNLFESIPWINLLIILVSVLALFSLVYALVSQLSKWLNLGRNDRITALFCGSKKSLVHGSVMSSVLFKGMAAQGLMLLPIMLYHAIQLVIISFIAQKMGKTAEK